MARIEKTVFISYRRENASWAIAISQNLSARGFDVFFDYQSINSGDFVQIIVENIKGRAHFLVLLTPSALEKCDQVGDMLRLEIETAVREKRNIVPLIFEGFDFESPSTRKALTGELATLKRYGGMSVPAEYFVAAMERLCNQFLNVSLETVIHPVSLRARTLAQKQKEAASKIDQVDLIELSAQEWYERGYLYRKNGNFAEASRCYEKAIELNPNWAIAHVKLGICLRHLGLLNQAIYEFNEAVRLDNSSAEAFTSRAEAKIDKNDLVGAILDSTEAIRVDPEYELAYNSRGVAFVNSGDLKTAIENYTKAAELNPTLEVAYNNLGNAYLRLGDLEKARKEFENRIRLSPTNALNAEVSLGVILRKLGETGSEKHFLTALNLWDRAWRDRLQPPSNLLANKAIAFLCLARLSESILFIEESLANRHPGDIIEFVFFDLLKDSPDPPDGIDEILALLNSHRS